MDAHTGWYGEGEERVTFWLFGLLKYVHVSIGTN